MIKGLMGEKGIVVGSGNTSVPYIPQNQSTPMQGMIRVWGTDMQVFDGSAWMNIATSYATVSLDQETQDLLMWAKAQRTMAMNRLTLAQNNPALMKALEKLKKAEDNFELLSKFVEHDKEHHEAMTTLGMCP
jgi:hypothetical protein